MNRIAYVLLCCVTFLTACRNDDWEAAGTPASEAVSFRIQCTGYENDATRGSRQEKTDYDRVIFCVVDDSGATVPGIKGLYDRSSSEIRIEGLREGHYRLLVLGVAGDADADGVTVQPIGHIDDEWLSFPADLQRPLEAEYFYSQTPFRVVARPAGSGYELAVEMEGEPVQRRIIGRADFGFTFNNPYVETALLHKSVQLAGGRFRTGFTAAGAFEGRSNEVTCSMALDDTLSYRFPPTAEGEPLCGEIELTTRNYRGNTVRRTYAFALEEVAPNRIGHIHTTATHPDDNSATVFVTEKAFEKNGLDYILQDDEPKEVYTDAAQRSFNTAAPLQVSVTDDGRLHVRFYSPRELSDVLIRARIATQAGGEFFDLAYFDRIPAFADFYGELPATLRTTFARTESGGIAEIGVLSAEQLASAEFSVTSEDPFWEKLRGITHGWNIAFALYGGNPDLPDGGPVGNWMGIRPVHCREAVALFLNFTYMIDMPEHEEILRRNIDKLYGNGGVNDKVSVERVLQQMRQPRTLAVGLVYPGNGVIGLGGGSAFGAYQQAWFQHYWNTYSCEIMFHELGHVMGYSHSSSFTYGPWAQELMNHFYVDHIAEMPVDSPAYLNSAQNPNKY